MLWCVVFRATYTRLQISALAQYWEREREGERERGRERERDRERERETEREGAGEGEGEGEGEGVRTRIGRGGKKGGRENLSRNSR